ncbi:hypothetical protein Anas_01931 [Armadillidium nasatum]|uniref:Uncharacterized protein n=1 Tax=Armadillidium nasatum TaxID=96803 RepID=A0A5N5T4Y5_9CRUS|nr:hypothetical protein Anas_01931 [Armadillidium nasatum]
MKRPSLNSLNRFRDSDEVIFNTNRFRQQTPLNRINRFRDSDEVIFTGGTRSPTFNRVGGFSDSDEILFTGRPRPSSFNRINRFDDSKEIFGSTRRGTFFVDSAEDLFKRTRNLGGNARGSFFGSSINRNPPTFNRNSLNNRIKLDSVEDVFEDLFDDDLDDRLRAQNTLNRLQNSGFNLFGNRGNTQNRGVTSFQTRVGSNRFNTPSTLSNTGSTFTNSNPINHFSAAQHINRIPSSVFSSSANRNDQTGNFGVPLRTSALQRSAPTTTNKFTQNTSNRRTTGNSLNSINSSPFSASKRSSFPSPPGFNWPGGNGYYVSMSTGNSKPVTYFVKYDD